MTGCGMCGNTLLESQVSPNGEMKLVSFLYDCGATTGFSTQVSVLDSDAAVISSGNLLTTDGKNKLQLSWLSDHAVAISGTEKLKIHKQETEYDGVSVIYR